MRGSGSASAAPWPPPTARATTPARTPTWPTRRVRPHLAVFDDDQVVGTAGAFSLELTLPGSPRCQRPGCRLSRCCPPTGVAPYSACSCSGTSTMPMPAASRSACCTPPRRASRPLRLRHRQPLRRVRAGFAAAAFHAPGQDSGRVRLVKGDEALRLPPAVHDRHCRRQPGDIARFSWLWELIVRDPPSGCARPTAPRSSPCTRPSRAALTATSSGASSRAGPAASPTTSCASASSAPSPRRRRARCGT
jgi:hypothetical protein